MSPQACGDTVLTLDFLKAHFVMMRVGTLFPAPQPQPRIPGPVLQLCSSLTPHASGSLLVCFLKVLYMVGWSQTLHLAEGDLEPVRGSLVPTFQVIG